jgi:hypothetical protein
VPNTEHKFPDQWLGERLPDVIVQYLDGRLLLTEVV